MMKKNVIRLAIMVMVLCVGLNTKAQDDKAITFGVKGGLNISNIAGEDSEDDADSKIGFNIGLTLDYAITPEWYVFSGLEYSLKGAKAEDYSLNLGYLQLPIYAGYKYDLGSAKIIGKVGPYLAYALHGNHKFGDVSVNAFSPDLEGVIKLNRFDLGVGVGIGVDFGKFNIGITYELGVSNILSKIEGESVGTNRNKNLLFSVGYKF